MRIAVLSLDNITVLVTEADEVSVQFDLDSKTLKNYRTLLPKITADEGQTIDATEAAAPALKWLLRELCSQLQVKAEYCASVEADSQNIRY
jgi:hypothetical protein